MYDREHCIDKMENKLKEEMIEEWMRTEYPDMSDVRDLELAEGVKFVDRLKRLLDVAEDYEQK